GARPATGRARDPCTVGRLPARSLGVAGRDHRPLLRQLAVLGAERGLTVISTPHVDWFALSPTLALLGAGAMALLGAVLVPRRARRPFGATVCAFGFAGALVGAALLYGFSAGGQGVIGDAIQRDRLGALATMIVAGA